MKNTTELRQGLDYVWESLKEGKMTVKEAKAMIAASNSYLKSAQLEMEHSKMTNDERLISFLKTPE